MIEFEKNIQIADDNWLMSTREKLGLIGLLYCMNPQKVIEFGFHRGGATKWLSRFSKKVITVDVNEFVSEATSLNSNVEAWNLPTSEAIKRIHCENLFFDLAIVDADHSRKAVAHDLKGILSHADVVLLHDSFNPQCRKGMLDVLKKQSSHAYYLDFIPSILKDDGLWGGLAIAWKSEHGGPRKEFPGEKSSYAAISMKRFFHLKSNVKKLKLWTTKYTQVIEAKLRIFGGKFFGKKKR